MPLKTVQMAYIILTILLVYQNAAASCSVHCIKFKLYAVKCIQQTFVCKNKLNKYKEKPTLNQIIN